MEIEDSSITIDEEWFIYNDQETFGISEMDKPKYKIGHVLAPKRLPVPTGHITIYAINREENEYFYFTDYGNMSVCRSEGLDDGYEVTGICDVKNHIEYQIQNLNKVLDNI